MHNWLSAFYALKPFQMLSIFDRLLKQSTWLLCSILALNGHKLIWKLQKSSAFSGPVPFLWSVVSRAQHKVSMESSRKYSFKVVVPRSWAFKLRLAQHLLSCLCTFECSDSYIGLCGCSWNKQGPCLQIWAGILTSVSLCVRLVLFITAVHNSAEDWSKPMKTQHCYGQIHFSGHGFTYTFMKFVLEKIFSDLKSYAIKVQEMDHVLKFGCMWR